MTIDAETLNSLATIPLLAGGFFAALSLLVYGFGSPWYKSGLGSVFLGIMLAATIVSVVPALRRLLGEYPGYEWVALACYSIYGLAWACLFVVVLVERRRAPVVLLPVAKSRR